jgi:SAM-dependent methyltransferase
MSSDESPQNIYDDPQFFAGYSSLARFGAGWHMALEQPIFLGLLPPAAGRRVLDLGCGAGQLAFHLAEAGAAEVIGIDISEHMLALARAERAHPRVTYRLEPIEDSQFPADAFDLVVSSLAFHYVQDYRRLIQNIGRWLAPGGTLVFSTEHPLYTARLPRQGWVLDDAGRRVGWSIDHYAREGAREEVWFVRGVRKYHRTLSTLLNELIDAGLSIERIVEPSPSEERLQTHPREADESRRPMFLLVRAARDSPAAAGLFRDVRAARRC